MDKMEQKRKGESGDSVSVEKKQKTHRSDKKKVSQKDDALECGIREMQTSNLDKGDCAGPSKQAEMEGNATDDWMMFTYQSKPPSRNWSGHEVIYWHWLRKDYTSLGEDRYYDDFDTLIHATSVDNAEKIFEYGGLKHQVVKDSSIINPTIQFYKKKSALIDFNSCHPMVGSEVVWYGPYKREYLKTPKPEIKRYGNAVFSMKTLFGFEGIIRKPGDFNYYFVEIVDYLTQSACRILITKKEYPQLLKYNPFVKGGPWYINKNGRHKHLTKIKNLCRRNVPNTLEFMREEEEPFRYMWLANHDISFKHCENPRSGVSISEIEEYDNDRLKLALGLLAYKMKSGSKSVVQQWDFLNGEKSPLDTLEDMVEPLMERYIKEHQENDPATVEYDGPHAVEFNWLKERFKDHSLYNWLKEEIDMNVFDITNFIKCLLIYYKNRFFLVNGEIKMIELFLKKTFPQHRSSFFKTLIDMIRKNLFHIYSENVSDTEEMFGMSVRQNHSTSTSEDREPVHNQHWLPNDRTDFGSDFEEFDTLIHTTSLMNAYEIFEAGKLFPLVLSDIFEGIQKELQALRHPLTKVNAVLYHPEPHDEMTKGYFSDHNDRNVVFAMKTMEGLAGIVERKGDEKIIHPEKYEGTDVKDAEGDFDRKGSENFRYYFIDVEENENTCVCKILVTQKPYPQLRSYDPNLELGPWYVKNNKHYYSKKVKNLKGELVTSKVEFYREEHDNESLSIRWLTNHEIQYKPDRNQGKGDGELKLALGLLACKFTHSNNLVLQQWFLLGGSYDIYDVLENIHENMKKELSECREETDGCVPDRLSKHIAQLIQLCHFGQDSELSKQMDIRNILVDMTSFIQGILKFYRRFFFCEEVELTTFFRTLFSLVSPNRLSMFLEELKWTLQDHALHRIHTKTLAKDWTGFSYYIKHAGVCNSEGSHYVRHWLPRDFKELLPEDYTCSAADRGSFYKTFDVLMKSPDEKNYERDGSGRLLPKLHRIDGASVANKKKWLYDSSFRKIDEHYSHPLNNAEIYCYMADTLDNVKDETERRKKYGDNTFMMKSLWGSEGIYRYKNNFKYYLIEIIDFQDESVCRILATYRNIPHLKKLDTEIEDEPVYMEKREYLCMITNSKGVKVKNRVEVLREVGSHYRYSNAETFWMDNHTEI